MPLISKYQSLPQGRFKTLMAQLPVHWQEGVSIYYEAQDQPPKPRFGANFPEASPYVILPAHRELLLIFDEMEMEVRRGHVPHRR